MLRHTTQEYLPDLAVSLVLYFSPLPQLQTLLDSISRAAVEAELSCVEVICVDHSCDADYGARCQTLFEAYSDETDSDNGLQISLLTPDQSGLCKGHNLAVTRWKFHQFESRRGAGPDAQIGLDL